MSRGKEATEQLTYEQHLSLLPPPGTLFQSIQESIYFHVRAVIDHYDASPKPPDTDVPSATISCSLSSLHLLSRSSAAALK